MKRSVSGDSGEEIKLVYQPAFVPRFVSCPSRSSVTIPTELYRTRTLCSWKSSYTFCSDFLANTTSGAKYAQDIKNAMQLFVLRIKGTEREADNRLPSSNEFKNVWNHTFTPTHAYMASCLIKETKSFIFHFVSTCCSNPISRSICSEIYSILCLDKPAESGV